VHAAVTGVLSQDSTLYIYRKVRGRNFPSDGDFLELFVFKAPGRPRPGWDNMRKRRKLSFGGLQIFHAQVFLHGAEMDRKNLRQKN